MDSLEARNLNRLKNGKMMLEYGTVKKGWGLAFLLTLFFGWTGVHRYYLGHKKIAALILAVTAFIFITFYFGQHWPQIFTNGATVSIVCLQVFLLLELILSFWVTTRVNNSIKNELKIKYGVQDYYDNF